MQHIDEARLESDLEYRFAYLADFVGFDGQDVAAIHSAAGALSEAAPQLIEAVYEKLFSYDATKRHFMPRQHGYEGPLPDNLAELTHDHPMIRFRKQHLARYLTALVTRPYDHKMVAYLDTVGKMHTPQAGSAQIDVPLVQMNALMGFVSDALTATILELDVELADKARLLRAFNKLLWLQNDLITRHYQAARQTHVAAA
jgi:hypothetical protein